MLRTLSIGPAVFPTAQLVLIIGFYLSLEAISRYAKDRQFHHKIIQNALLTAFIVGLIGARLVYVAFNWSVYQDDLVAIVQPTLQGLHTLGGLAMGSFVVLIYAYRAMLDLRPLLDMLAPGIALMAGAFSIVALAQGDYFGMPTDLPWGIDLWGAMRHPTQVYLLIGNILVGLIWFFGQKNHRQANAGYGFLLVVAGNALNWLVIALWMDAPTLVLDNYRRVQIEMWAILIVAGFLWNWWSDHPLIYTPSEPKRDSESQQSTPENQAI